MKYKALTNIHADVKYAIGDELELTEAEAAPLLEAKAIAPSIKPFSKSVEKTALHSNSLEH
jgi:hypothetical protein